MYVYIYIYIYVHTHTHIANVIGLVRALAHLLMMMIFYCSFRNKTLYINI
jgi:hypothetical protein